MTIVLGGFKSRSNELRNKVEPSTAQLIGPHRQGNDVVAQVAYALVVSDTCEANSSIRTIVATGIEASAKEGYAVLFTSGVNSGLVAFIQSVATNEITLSQTLSQAPGVGDGFDLVRPSFLKTGADGTVAVSVATPATVNQGLASASGPGWAVQFRGPSGLPTVNFNIAGVYEVPAVVIGDPFTGSPWNFISGRGLVQMRSTLSAHVSVAASVTNVTLLADQPLRAGGSVYNDSTANMYLKLGATASTTSFTTIVRPNQYFEIPFGYQGIIDAVWSSATGNARIMECY